MRRRGAPVVTVGPSTLYYPTLMSDRHFDETRLAGSRARKRRVERRERRRSEIEQLESATVVLWDGVNARSLGRLGALSRDEDPPSYRVSFSYSSAGEVPGYDESDGAADPRVIQAEGARKGKESKK